MTKTKSGLPEHPEQTFALPSPAADAPPAHAMPDPPTWTVAAEATRTVAYADVPSVAVETGPAVAYRMRKQIGQGAMGEVWEAEQTSLGRIIAVKRLRRKRDQKDAEERSHEVEFRSESTIAASLEHPNILPVYDLGRDAAGNLLLAMKRVHGTPWDYSLRTDFAGMPVDAYLARHIPILMSVAQAVAFAHSRGVIHRDLKPSQVLVGAFGEVLLTDWGLAIQMDAAVGDAAASAPVGTPRPWTFTPDTATNPAGTPAMMAPEQTETHGGNLGPWTDVYLLGGILYYLLSGYYPHSSDSSEAAFGLARTGRVPPLASRVPDRSMPAELEQLCLKALEPDRTERLASAADFLQGLEDFQSGTVRKRKSAELVAAVTDQLQQGEPDQAGYTAAIASLEEARRLWPDNPDVGELRQHALSASTRLALDQGDLSFAQLQCDAMDAGAQADTLRGEIAVRKRRLARRRSMLRLATAAVFVLLVVIAAGALVFSQRMQAANKNIAQHAKQTEQALNIAKTRSSGAADLINFVLDDLKKAMDSELTPKHGVTAKERGYLSNAIVGKVAAPVAKYFAEIKPDKWPKDMQTELADHMSKTGQRLADIGGPDDAIPMLQRSLAINERNFGSQSTEIVKSLIRLGMAYDQIDQLDKAEAFFRRALAIGEAKLAPTDPIYMATLNDLANVLKEQSQLDEAAAMYERVLAIPHPNPSNELKAHRVLYTTNLSYLLLHIGKAKKAESMMRKALATWKEIEWGKAHPTGNSFILGALGQSLVVQGKYAEAEPLLRKAATNMENVAGPDNRLTGIFLYYLGSVQRLMHQPRKADVSLRRALKIETATFGPDHYRTAAVLRSLGILQHQTGHDAEAESNLRHAITIYGPKKSNKPDEAAWTRYQLALVLEDAGRLRDAHKLMQGAAKMLHDTLGTQHPHTVAAQKALASLDARLKHGGS